MAREPLTQSERDYAAWVGNLERRVVLPLKWGLAIICLLYWMWSRNWQLPSEPAFGLFFLFVAFTAAEQYFFIRDRILPSQVYGFVYASFLLDALTVAALVVLDFHDPATVVWGSGFSEFYLLFILLVLRGLALYRTRAENIFTFSLVSVLFLVSVSYQLNSAVIVDFNAVLRRLALVWAIMLLVQAFIGLVNEQQAGIIRQRERLVQSASLASIGELTAGVAHEINNPIGIIKTYVDFLEKNTLEDDPLREDFQTIRAEAERCEQIVRRMLDFSNPRIEGFSSVDVRALVEETARLVFPEERGSTVSARVESAASVPMVEGDAVQLRQAFLNILLNAKQIIEEDRARSEGGVPGLVRIVVSRGTGPRPPVRLRFIDNGPGITAEDASRVFEPFFTKRKKGTGLGLSITRRIIEVHSGTIEIGPAEEGGTVVTVELPIEGEEKA